MRRWWSAGIAAVMLVSAAACGTVGGDGDDGGGKKSRAAAGEVTPPPGGWPQPVNGRVTEEMCDLLTDADYARYGHPQLPYESREISRQQPDRVVCLRTGGSTFEVALRPTVTTAELEYKETLRSHKERMLSDRRRMILVTDLVPGADASWFDYATLGDEDRTFLEYEIRVRRGRLLLAITMSVKREHEGQDPKTTLAGLAQRVLERLPGVGAQDAGQTATVVYELLGTGTAERVTYWDTESSEQVQRTGVRLPWRRKLSFDPQAAKTVPFTLNGWRKDPLAGVIRCRISVNGRVLIEDVNTMGANCIALYQD